MLSAQPCLMEGTLKPDQNSKGIHGVDLQLKGSETCAQSTDMHMRRTAKPNKIIMCPIDNGR